MLMKLTLFFEVARAFICMHGKVQLNFQVPKKLAEKVRSDARRNNKTLDAVGETILSEFFSAWTLTERARFYEGKANKRSGRRIGSSKLK